MNDAERLRTYLAGWDDAIECWNRTIEFVPDEQLVPLIREQRRRQLADRRAS